ncbi:hypothetical protein CFP71_40610 [Amycolatopsis thailandensis]|uniref:Uncharacterized protein n=1 Tax=Amycolatopsis thailandensis TaxID=589330 RepID=A0A229RC83_9PSEU|nr:hypothetical protein CFP71_40610 [Amycolatopsis thailandensis]
MLCLRHACDREGVQAGNTFHVGVERRVGTGLEYRRDFDGEIQPDVGHSRTHSHDRVGTVDEQVFQFVADEGRDQSVCHENGDLRPRVHVRQCVVEARHTDNP